MTTALPRGSNHDAAQGGPLPQPGLKQTSLSPKRTGPSVLGCEFTRR
jgi:hypothetical protein